MINHPLPLDVGLQIEIWLTEVQQEALPEEIFDRLGSEYVYSVGEDAPELPNAIYIKLDAKPDNTEARTATLPMIKELSEAPTLGSLGDQRLNEEDWITKHFQMQYTDVSHATTNMKYGIEAITKQPYKIFEYRAKGLGKYFKQYFGKMRRQALLEQIAENLGEAPHFLAAAWGMNWYVPNVENWNQPVYSTSYATFTNSIVAALIAAGTGQNAAGTVVYFQRLEEWARTEKFINTIDFEDGTDGYVVLLPTPTARWMKNPTTGFPTLGALYRDSTEYTKEVHFMFPGFIGQIGCLRFVEDPRYPTLTLGGSASGSQGAGAGYSMTAQYRGMGRADDGSSDPRDKSASARLVGFLLGKGCLCEWMPEGFHWEWEYEQYDKYFGSGIFMSVGIRNPMYNFTGGVSANVQQDNCIILPFAQPPQLV
jgi:hypothetical protein